MSDLTEFLLARIAEDVRDAYRDFGENEDVVAEPGTWLRWVLDQCESRRRVVEWHQQWPVLVQTQPEMEPVLPGDMMSMTLRMARQIAWLTEKEYRARFGDEPPTAPILRILALPYANHPDYNEAWRP